MGTGNTIVGRWEMLFEGKTNFWVINANGTFETNPNFDSANFKGTYRLEGNKLVTQVPGMGSQTFKVGQPDENTLILAAYSQRDGSLSREMVLKRKTLSNPQVSRSNKVDTSSFDKLTLQQKKEKITKIKQRLEADKAGGKVPEKQLQEGRALLNELIKKYNAELNARKPSPKLPLTEAWKKYCELNHKSERTRAFGGYCWRDSSCRGATSMSTAKCSATDESVMSVYNGTIDEKTASGDY